MEQGRTDTDLEMGGYLPNTLYAYDRRAPRLDGVQSRTVTGVTIAATGKIESLRICVSITGIAINILALASCLFRGIS